MPLLLPLGQAELDAYARVYHGRAISEPELQAPRGRPGAVNQLWLLWRTCALVVYELLVPRRDVTP